MSKPGELVAEYLNKEKQKADDEFRKSSRSNLTSTGLSGALWWSDKEWKIMRDRGRERCYGELSDGRIVEYTELISIEALQENPADACGFDDAKFLGMGKFHHWRDIKGAEW
jgi:hypothetical protein